MKSFFLIIINLFLLISTLCAQIDSSQIKRGKMSGGKNGNSSNISTPKDDSDTAIIAQIKANILSAQADTGILGINLDKKDEKVAVIKKPFRLDQLRPRQVLILGLIIPSAGQIYNQKWWKLPLVYGGLGAVGYWVYNNRINYLKYRRAYLYAVDNNPFTTGPAGNIANLKSNRDRYQNLYERSLLLGLGLYALVAIDGFVDAHLKTFEVGDNLSLKIQPKLFGDGLGTVRSGLGTQRNAQGIAGSSWNFIQPTLSLKFYF